MSGCIFCSIARGEAEASVVRTEGDYLAFMDIFPFRPGHVLVIPKRHAQWVHELEPAEQGELFRIGARVAAAVRRSSIPSDDLHFLINDGPAANQTVPHVHLHVVPRRRGDLPSVVAELAKRPIVTLLGQAPRALLDRQAATIAAALDGV
jgi:histidine triad (HIT) family protein